MKKLLLNNELKNRLNNKPTFKMQELYNEIDKQMIVGYLLQRILGYQRRLRRPYTYTQSCLSLHCL